MRSLLDTEIKRHREGRERRYQIGPPCTKFKVGQTGTSGTVGILISPSSSVDAKGSESGVKAARLGALFTQM